MPVRKEASRRNAPEQKTSVSQIKAVPEVGAQKTKDIKPAVSHSQDADRHSRTEHRKSGK